MPDTEQATELQGEAGALPSDMGPVKARVPDAPLIVAIGASAGGLAAFQSFFAAMPPKSGMAFVLIQHLDPHYQSMLVEILSRAVDMPVAQAADGVSVEANSVYVIPPDATLTISEGILHVEHPAPPRLHRWPINSFFTALAEDQGENAVGIVLSGIGSDGANGITSIKAHGGLTLAQSEYDHVAMSGMPENAAATGFVDFVLPLQEMPERLLRYGRHLDGIAGRKNNDGIRFDAADYLPQILGLLQARLSHDFSQYKTSTVIRRVQRRMQVLGVDNMAEYAERLRYEDGQTELLFRELLIGVTEFMRDPAAFAALRLALPGLLEGKGNHDTIRVWAPGCSTGEEVYSLAILLREACEQAGISPKVKIFGTDIDEAAIATARAALYPSAMRGLRPESIARWFTAEGECYRVVKSIREMCIFSLHNLIKDPPFSRLSLLSCRNLLIYMNAELQERVIRLFHYALRPDGLLFLGPSEGVTRNPGLFSVIDRKHRLYRKREPGMEAEAPEMPALVAMPPLTRSRPAAALLEDRIERGARAALEKHSPVYFVVDERHDIIRFSGGETGRYLEPGGGAATLALFVNLRKSLRPAVRAALHTAMTSRTPVTQDQVPLEMDGQLRTVTLIAEPISEIDVSGRLYVVAFRDLVAVKRRRAAKSASEAGGIGMQAMEAEVLAVKARLQVALEAAETANEETRSSIEEYQSVNEELQSSNEELETAKEEMQSINEELQTINTELNVKNDQLTRLNNDVQNLLESTQIATIFLDAEMRIKGFTPAMRELFRLQVSDQSRPLADIATRLSYDRLWADISQVLRDHRTLEREVKLADSGITFIMRIMPYSTGESGVDGAVLTFVDITARKKSEQALRDQAAIIEFAHDAFFRIDFDGVICSWNAAAVRLFGYTAAQAIGQPALMLCAEHRREEQAALMQAARTGAIAGPVDTLGRRQDGGFVDVELTLVAIRGETGEATAYACAAHDITGRIKAERHRTLLLHELSHRVKNALATVQSMAAQTLRHSKTLSGFQEVFLARLIALATTHDLLTRADWEGALLRDVLEAELRPYQPKDRRRWTITGPDLRLGPKTALALGLAFHELTTNAVKFGALSAPSGQLDVIWQKREAETGPRLHIVWAEGGGPPVKPPERKGFGSRLIGDGLAYELDGTVEVDFDPAGVRCVIDVPLVSHEDMP